MTEDESPPKDLPPEADQISDPDSDPGYFQLRLYVAGQTVKSLAAMANLTESN
jgi:hypothetical protein